MAMRTMARRWPGSSSQMRSMLRSGRQQEQLQQSRAYAPEESYTGKGLDEKEKAAETRYIRKMEEDRNLKKAAEEAGKAAAGESVASTPIKTAAGAAVTEGGGFRNTAVVAGLVAAVAGYWLWSSSGSSKKVEKEST